MIHYPDGFDIVRDRQAHARRTAAVRRSVPGRRPGSSLRSGLAGALIRAGERLAPAPPPPAPSRPAVRLVTGRNTSWYGSGSNGC